MLIPDEIRKCCAFLFYETGQGLRVAGTGFFIGMRADGDGGRYWVYLVTANHVISGIRAKSTDGMARVRLNGRAGGVWWQEIHVDRWRSDTRTELPADVAIVGFAPPRDEVDYKIYPIDQIATDEVIAAQKIGLGDEIAIAGLFANHQGRERNIPIVRIGNIAAMPEEPVSSSLGLMDAYLVEARSIGGLSGSPVFVNTVLDRSDSEPSLLMSGMLTGSHLFLLGVMHGHWDVPVAQADSILSLDGPGIERINMGIGIVVPATKVLDLVNSPDLVESRRSGGV